ncbi:hypothetical protein ANCDUO_22436 [Ancylostoma duodenale]|uniref:Glycosyltransferase family 92 protein n=1 Tax=Ancylostoma duodenale TaxID=51022 RepID=A0A0C2CCD1_9BILA|nr:hypothetical protein ANCDUO_22436 [Ancylostoma duodenale]
MTSLAKKLLIKSHWPLQYTSSFQDIPSRPAASLLLQVPVRQPYSEPHDVVACFSPLFLNERWQLLLLTAEVYSYYGAAMHFYVRSMITDLFSILSRYPNARVNPWPAVQLGSKRANSLSFDPNLELEFRNQAAAMTDCLLLYKESAKFIIFPDTDDIIIPRLGRTYLEEFQKVSTNHM